METVPVGSCRPGCQVVGPWVSSFGAEEQKGGLKWDGRNDPSGARGSLSAIRTVDEGKGDNAVAGLILGAGVGPAEAVEPELHAGGARTTPCAGLSGCMMKGMCPFLATSPRLFLQRIGNAGETVSKVSSGTL